MTFASFPDRPDLQRGVQEEVEGDPEDTPNPSLRFQTRYKHVFLFLLESDECSSGVDACQGDSGGPASVLKNGRQTQVKERLRRVVGMNGWEGYLGWSFADWDCQPGKGMRGPEVSRTLHTCDFYIELDQERYGWVQSLE